jgi:hypothetical protein
LNFVSCRANEGIFLTGGEVSELGLTGSLVGGILADGVIVKRSVFLGAGFAANREVVLLGAQIGDILDCEGGSFRNPGGVGALIADGIKVKGSVRLRDGFLADGEVRLDGAQIGGGLECNRGTFRNPGRRALTADHAVVKGSASLDDGFYAEGYVDFSGAQIAEEFICSAGDFHNATLDLRDTSVATLYDSGLGDSLGKPTIWPPHGQLLLDGFTYGKFANVPDLPKRLAWLGLQPQTPFPSRSYLQLADVLWKAGDGRGAFQVLSGMRGQIRQSEFQPQPYLELAKVLRDYGDDDGAKRLLIEMEDRARRGSVGSALVRPLLRSTIGYGYDPLRAFWWELGLSFLGWIVYRRSYLAGAMAPTEEKAYERFKEPGGEVPAHYPRFSPLIYSVENSLPLVKLGQGDRWQPDPQGQRVPARKRPAGELAYRATWEWFPARLSGGMRAKTVRLTSLWSRAPRGLQNCLAWLSAKTTAPRFVMWFLWIQILLGWLLATLFVAGVSGIVHRE